MNHDDIVRSQELVGAIGAMLHGHGPDIQGATLADLVAIFFAGHHPDVREESMRIWLDIMRELIPVNEQMIIGQGGWPEEGAE